MSVSRLYHYTTSTGDGRWSPRSEVSDSVIEHLQNCLREATKVLRSPEDVPPIHLGGGFWLPTTPSVSDTGVWIWELANSKNVLVHCWLVKNQEQSDEIWKEIKHEAESRDYLCVNGCPEYPCLAVVPLLEAKATREEWMAVADLERCMAWTLYDVPIVEG